MLRRLERRHIADHADNAPVVQPPRSALGHAVLAVLAPEAPARREGSPRREPAGRRAIGEVFGVREGGDVLAHQLFLRVAQHVGRGAVDLEDVAERINHEDARGEVVEEVEREQRSKRRVDSLHVQNLSLRPPIRKDLPLGPWMIA